MGACAIEVKGLNIPERKQKKISTVTVNLMLGFTERIYKSNHKISKKRTIITFEKEKYCYLCVVTIVLKTAVRLHKMRLVH